MVPVFHVSANETDHGDWLTNTAYLLLAPGEHWALSISRICTDYPKYYPRGFPTGEVFRGIVKLFTEGDPVAATALRTVAGIVISRVEVNGTGQ